MPRWLHALTIFALLTVSVLVLAGIVGLLSAVIGLGWASVVVTALIVASYWLAGRVDA